MKNIFIKKNTYSLNRLYLILLLFASLCMGIGYTTITSTVLDIVGDVVVQAQDGIFITSVEYLDGQNANLEYSKIISTNQTNLNSNIVLGNNGDSYITYKVTIYNSTKYNYFYDKTDFLVCDPGEVNCDTYSNQNIVFDLNMQRGAELNSKGYITFNITFKYKDSYLDATNNSLKSILNFKFKEIIPPINVQSLSGNYSLSLNCSSSRCASYDENNFYLNVERIVIPEPAYGPMTFTKKYNPTTGVLQLTRSSLTGYGFITYSGKVFVSEDAVFINTVNGSYSVSIDCTSVDDYQNKTADDFFYVIERLDAPYCTNDTSSQYGVNGTLVFTKSYNASTGRLTITRSSITGNGTVTMSVSAYYSNK